MTFVFFCLGLGQCLFLFLLFRVGQRLEASARLEREALRYAPPGGWPRLGLIIPLGAVKPETEAALTSLLNQDYPDFIPLIVTAEESGPVQGLLWRLEEQFPGLRHVVAGLAENCGQKNFNTLAGLRALGSDAQILAFADSSHEAKPDFLRALALPIASGEADFATGYHCVRPMDSGLASLGYSLCVQLMRYLQALGSFTQPWGGAMAMSRAAFERLDIAGLWASNVVDDCSLAAFLFKRGLKVKLCAAALLSTKAHNESWSCWRAWLMRQILFLKFCIPGQWRLLGILVALMAIPPIWAGLVLLLGLVGKAAGAAVFMALLWLISLAWALRGWRAAIGKNIPLGRWLLAFYCAVGVFSLDYLLSIAAKGIKWQKIAYTVGPGGLVLAIQRGGASAFDAAAKAK